MPVAYPWKRRDVSALAILTVALVGMPSRLYADQLVLSIAGDNLVNEGSQALRPDGVHGADMNGKRMSWLGFTAADGGTEHSARGDADDPASLSDAPAAENSAAAVAALVLMVGDVPGMPQSEITDPGSIGGLRDISSGTLNGSTSPPATPEPTALLAGLLGGGLTGAYALCRRQKRRHSTAY